MNATRRAFVLLEVMVALIILAVAMTAILRGFIVVLGTIRENATALKATLLAESLLDDLELEPPAEGHAEGDFADDDRFGEEYAHFSWDREVEEESVRYDGFPADPMQDEEPLYKMTVKILYDDGKYRKFTPIVVTTYLLENEIHTREALQSSQLF